MKKGILAIPLFLLIVQLFFPQDSQLRAKQKEEPTTKLEAFLITKGSLLIKEIISVKAPFSYVDLNAILVYEPNKEDEKIRGIKFEVNEYTNSGAFVGKESAFLDLEEIENVLKSIDYLITTAAKWQNLDSGKTYTAVEYSTTGDFKIGVYHEGKKQQAYISCGSYSVATRFFKSDDLPNVKAWISEAFSLIKQ